VWALSAPPSCWQPQHHAQTACAFLPSHLAGAFTQLQTTFIVTELVMEGKQQGGGEHLHPLHPTCPVILVRSLPPLALHQVPELEVCDDECQCMLRRTGTAQLRQP
jgi:hypothetical protein